MTICLTVDNSVSICLVSGGLSVCRFWSFKEIIIFWWKELLNYHLNYFSFLYKFLFQKTNTINVILPFPIILLHDFLLALCTSSISYSHSMLVFAFNALYKIVTHNYPLWVPYHSVFLSDMGLFVFLLLFLFWVHYPQSGLDTEILDVVDSSSLLQFHVLKKLVKASWKGF